MKSELTGEDRDLREKALNLTAKLVGPGRNKSHLKRFKEAYIFILDQLVGESHPLYQENQRKDSGNGGSPS